MPHSPDDEVILGLGANLGDPLAQLAAAVQELTRVLPIDRLSSVYRTEPVGYRDQPDFYNLVAVGRAEDADPEELMRALLDVERSLGRERSFANAPRTIDVDLLAYGARIVHTPDLTLPHPRMHERGFVLHPLDEVAPAWRHPVLGSTARELLFAGTAKERVRRMGPLYPFSGALAPGRPSG